MKAIPLDIPEVMIIEPEVFHDDRGLFYESYNQNKFSEIIGRQINFVQDNRSKSIKGVIRGLHYQLEPFSQAKLISVIKGEIFDVALDIRDQSKTRGQWIAKILSDKNRQQLWIPEGFAHGFLALSDEAEVFYKTTKFYESNSERGINPFDKTIGIEWPKFKSYIVNDRDKNFPSLD